LIRLPEGSLAGDGVKLHQLVKLLEEGEEEDEEEKEAAAAVLEDRSEPDTKTQYIFIFFIILSSVRIDRGNCQRFIYIRGST
jgi:hypothetical protein